MFTSTQKIAQRLLPVLAVLLAGTTTQAEDRYALVIGNSEYAEQPLKNPINDARVMKEKLEALDFDVTMKLDLDRKQMRAAMRQFNRRLPTDSIACVFFAGHGMRVDNRNYLVPIGSSFTEVWELEDETITEDYIRKMIQASRSRVNILILDCCLNNPFQDRAWRGRSAVTPLDFIHSPSIEGTATIYSTANGKRAEDGEGQNSPFTDALARALTLRPEGGLKLDDALKVVDRIMVTERGRDQKPHVTFDLSVMDFPLYVTAKTAKPLGLPLPRKPSLPPAARPKPTPDKIAKDLLPPPSVDAVDDSILALAGNYLNVGKYELAIESYNAVLEDPSVSGRVRRLARLKRGQAYLRRGKTNDIDRALIDYKASGQDGIPMRFRVATTSLKIKAAVTATARRDQSAVVTHIRHDPGMTWYYVKSIDLDKTQRGWVTADAFRDSAKKVVAGSAADPRLNTTTSAPRPSPITVPQALPTTRPNSQRAQSVPSRSAQASTNWNRGSNGSNSSQSHNSRSGSLSGSGINTATWDTAKTQRRQKWANDFQRKNGRAPTVMETPWWENQREMQHNWRSRGMDPSTGKPMNQSRSGGSNSRNRSQTMWWRNR